MGSLLSGLVLSAVVKVFITDWLAQKVKWMPFVNQATVWVTVPMLVIGAVVLSIIASSVALRRYLRA